MQDVSPHRRADGHRGDPAWVRAIVVAPAAVALLLFSGIPVLQTAASRFLKRQRRHPLLTLRTSVVGRHRARIRSMLGPPRTATGGASGVWYYPVDRNDRLAMAIRFDGDRARSVEFFSAPE